MTEDACEDLIEVLVIICDVSARATNHYYGNREENPVADWNMLEDHLLESGDHTKGLDPCGWFGPSDLPSRNTEITDRLGLVYQDGCSMLCAISELLG